MITRSAISVGVDRMQRNVEPMRRQVEMWQRSELTDVTAKIVIYRAYVRGQTGSSEAPSVRESVFTVVLVKAMAPLAEAKPPSFTIENTSTDPPLFESFSAAGQPLDRKAQSCGRLAGSVGNPGTRQSNRIRRRSARHRWLRFCQQREPLHLLSHHIVPNARLSSGHLPEKGKPLRPASLRRAQA